MKHSTDSLQLQNAGLPFMANSDEGDLQKPDITGDDELFIRNTMSQDPRQGMELLYLRYYQPLCTHAVKFVRSRQIAEDLVSDIFCQFYCKKIFQLITTSYRAYLFTTVRNQGYNYIKWELARNTPLEDGHILNMPECQQPDMITQYEDLYQDVENAINSLPYQRRGIYLQFHFEGKALKQIAQELDLSVRTVEVQVYRARQTIRKMIKDKWLLSAILACLNF
jgi:RNA polymerase sigma factor (sigma-70 family)